MAMAKSIFSISRASSVAATKVFRAVVRSRPVSCISPRIGMYLHEGDRACWPHLDISDVAALCVGMVVGPVGFSAEKLTGGNGPVGFSAEKLTGGNVPVGFSAEKLTGGNGPVPS